MPSGKLKPISSLVGSIDTAGGTKDHNRLLNRDLPDQHPIEAITGLLEAFNQIDSKIATIDQKIDSEAEFVASEIELINNELNSLTEQVAGLDTKFTNAIELLNERITEIREELQRIISELSIEELSKRDKIEYVLATEYDPEATYYEEVYDVDDTDIIGMWQLPDKLNYTEEILNFPWINNVDGYYYNGNGSKTAFSRFGCLTTMKSGEPVKDIYGVAVGHDWNGMYGIQEVARYSYGDEYIRYSEYNPLGARGYSNFSAYGQPENAMQLLYFETPHETSEKLANCWKFVGAQKVSDTLLPYGNYNYKTKLVQVEITEEEVEPNKYYIANPIPVIRIQLDSESSIYRDAQGNDVLKIVENNVLLNGNKLAPELSTSSDTDIQLVLENNAEVVYSDIASAEFTIPNNIKHGYCSSITFTTINIRPSSIRFINNSTYEIRYIYQNKATAFSDITFSGNCEYNVIIICNGRYVEVYIQEIEL